MLFRTKVGRVSGVVHHNLKAKRVVPTSWAVSLWPIRFEAEFGALYTRPYAVATMSWMRPSARVRRWFSRIDGGGDLLGEHPRLSHDERSRFFGILHLLVNNGTAVVRDAAPVRLNQLNNAFWSSDWFGILCRYFRQHHMKNKDAFGAFSLKGWMWAVVRMREKEKDGVIQRSYDAPRNLLLLNVVEATWMSIWPMQWLAVASR